MTALPPSTSLSIEQSQLEEVPMSALISLHGVTKRYDDSPQPALDRVDLDIEPGRITAIMGPSGGCKSTLLNLIGGLDRPTRVEVIGLVGR